jgi:hypothetical protein
MKSLLLTLIFSLAIARPSAEQHNTRTTDLPWPETRESAKDALLDAIIWVESKGDRYAVGDTYIDGASVGILQIQTVMVDDINRILALRGDNMRFSYDDRTDEQKSIAMFEIYVQHYHGSWDDAEAIARSWNGGPHWAVKRSTYRYWKRVQDALYGSSSNI